MSRLITGNANFCNRVVYRQERTDGVTNNIFLKTDDCVSCPFLFAVTLLNRLFSILVTVIYCSPFLLTCFLLPHFSD